NKWWLPSNQPRLTLYPIEDNRPEWTETPQYPPLFDYSKPDSNLMRKRLQWYEEIKALPTTEMKLFEITDKYRHRSVIFKNWAPNYDYLNLYQHTTRTHLIRNKLPSNYVDIDCKQYIESVKEAILDAIRCHKYEVNRENFTNFRPILVHSDLRLDVATDENLIQDINSVCQKVLAPHFPHLFKAQVDHCADVSSWWWHQCPPFTKRKHLSSIVNQSVQYLSEAVVQLRTDEPLPPIIEFDDPLCINSDVPHFPAHPVKDGFILKWNFLKCSPGFWSLDKNNKFDFPYLCYLSRNPIKLREKLLSRSYPDAAEFFDAMGVMHGFGWLNAVSAMHGFTPYQEITYPFTTHIIITDGQFWNFFVYQMNTHSFHSDIDRNDRRNVCWSSGEMKLYDTYENGEFKGINEAVIENLIKFMIRKPEPFANVEVRPYLGEDTRSEEEVNLTRTYLRRRFGQALTHKERYLLSQMRVFPYEKVHIRHHLAPPTVLWRMPYKKKIPFPTECFTRC
ncbi:28S ribosomal protein S30: mitochondrial-like isoform X1, partial [Dinothrombium tinctorium]